MCFCKASIYHKYSAISQPRVFGLFPKWSFSSAWISLSLCGDR